MGSEYNSHTQTNQEFCSTLVSVGVDSEGLEEDTISIEQVNEEADGICSVYHLMMPGRLIDTIHTMMYAVDECTWTNE
jgi:hypothetical protein